MNVGSSSSEARPKECFNSLAVIPVRVGRKAKALIMSLVHAAQGQGDQPSCHPDRQQPQQAHQDRLQRHTTVSLIVIDIQSPSYRAIGPPLTLENFSVPPQTMITMKKRLKVNDTTYIWDNYGGQVRFISVSVQVSSTVITSFPLGFNLVIYIYTQKRQSQPVFGHV